MVGIVSVGSVQSASVEKIADRCMNSFLKKYYARFVGLAKTVYTHFHHYAQKRETNLLLLLWLTPLH